MPCRQAHLVSAGARGRLASFSDGLAFTQSPGVFTAASLLQRLQSIPFVVAVHKEGRRFLKYPHLVP